MTCSVSVQAAIVNNLVSSSGKYIPPGQRSGRPAQVGASRRGREQLKIDSKVFNVFVPTFEWQFIGHTFSCLLWNARKYFCKPITFSGHLACASFSIEIKWWTAVGLHSDRLWHRHFIRVDVLRDMSRTCHESWQKGTWDFWGLKPVNAGWGRCILIKYDY